MTDKCTICLDREALGSDVPHWDALTPDQQELVIYLVADIADRECGPLSLEPSAGRMALARFEAAAADLSAEDCARELAGYLVDVSGRLLDEEQYGDVTDPYIATHTWTLKGLRHALARERLIESITCNVRGVHD